MGWIDRFRIGRGLVVNDEVVDRRDAGIGLRPLPAGFRRSRYAPTATRVARKPC
jgi:hypothetical protein